MSTTPSPLPPLGGSDREIVAALTSTWDAWRSIRQPWLWQVETNARALAGRQNDEWDPELGQYVDLSTVFAPADERWRQNPVFNWLRQTFYSHSLAKLTENIVQLGAMPATADHAAQVTASLFDPLYKYEWQQMGMAELNFTHYGWLLTAGESVLKLRWDPDRGDWWEFYGDRTVEVGPDQSPPLEFAGTIPERIRLGDLACDCLCPTSVLYPYGPEPDHLKPWVMQEYLLTVDEIFARFGVKVEPDAGAATNDSLIRMEYSSFYGNPGSPMGGQWGWEGGPTVVTEHKVRVFERWQRATPQEPYGRVTIVGGGQLLSDDINPYVEIGRREKVIIPFFRFPKPDLPFRQEGGTDVESLLPVARAKNRVWGSMLDQQSANEQPALIFNRNLIDEQEVANVNLVGARIPTDGNPKEVADYLRVPELSAASKELHALLQRELEDMGHIGQGTMGQPVTESASGELQREVRFDADRPWGATLRLHSYIWERFGQAMVDICAVCMEDERVLAMAGEDQALQFLTVRGELFQGAINVRVQPESMVLETRQDKQNRLIQMLNAAAALQPVNPEYAELLLSTLNYPNLQRVTQRGGPAYSLAQRDIATLIATGQMPAVWIEQDHGVYLRLIQEYMQTQAFGGLDPQRQALLRVFKQLHQQLGVQQGMEQVQQQAAAGALAQGIQMQAVAPLAMAQAQQQQAMQPPEDQAA